MALLAKQQIACNKATVCTRRSVARVVVCKASNANVEMVSSDPNGVLARLGERPTVRSLNSLVYSTASSHPLASLSLPDISPSLYAPTQPRRAALGMLAGVAALATGAAPSFAAYGDSANIFGKVTNTSGELAAQLVSGPVILRSTRCLFGPSAGSA